MSNPVYRSRYDFLAPSPDANYGSVLPSWVPTAFANVPGFSVSQPRPLGLMVDAGDIRRFEGKDYLDRPFPPGGVDLQSIGGLRDDPANPKGPPIPAGGMRQDQYIPWDALRHISKEKDGVSEFWIVPRPMM